MQNKRFIKIIFLSLGCGVAVSQRMDTIKSMLISDWQRAKSYTVELLEKIPAKKYNYKISVFGEFTNEKMETHKSYGK